MALGGVRRLVKGAAGTGTKLLKHAAQPKHRWRCAEIILSWVAVAAYIYFGGRVFRELELPAEKARQEKFCVKMDTLLQDLSISQRAHFSGVLGQLVDRGICRAPLCKVRPLPRIPLMIQLGVPAGPSTSSSRKLASAYACKQFMADSLKQKSSFKETLEAALVANAIPAAVTVTNCTDADGGFSVETLLTAKSFESE
jgi:hypothetical protein